MTQDPGNQESRKDIKRIIKMMVKEYPRVTAVYMT